MSAGYYWFEEKDAVRHLFYGVFEGGGAKGVAYNGALAAMQKQKCWFTAVAGASAGAITAALVAAGLSPEDVGNETETALGLVRTGMWAGLRRLQQETGYFPSEGLRNWLDGLLGKQVAIKKKSPPASGVTFKDLYDATHIELNIVAADLSRRCEVVFSHLDTPRCAVADAVVASSSIPFAFASRLLQVVEGTQTTHHTVVDGGVWSNFPMHVFEDEAFRRSYHRDPVAIDPARILGFVLHEGEAESQPHGEDVCFVEGVPKGQFNARERIPSRTKPIAASQTSLGLRLAAWALFPFSLLGRFAQWNGGVEAGRWPLPTSLASRNLLYSIDGLLGGLHAPLFGIMAIVIVGVGAWNVAEFLTIDQLRTSVATNWRDPIAYGPRALSVTLTALAVAVAILIAFATLLGVVANFVLLRAARRILYGLATTYVAGPGAPAWAVDQKDNIVALPIPQGVTTLAFELSTEQREATIAAAKRATITALHKVLPTEELAV